MCACPFLILCACAVEIPLSGSGGASGVCLHPATLDGAWPLGSEPPPQSLTLGTHEYPQWLFLAVMQPELNLSGSWAGYVRWRGCILLFGWGVQGRILLPPRKWLSCMCIDTPGKESEKAKFSGKVVRFRKINILTLFCVIVAGGFFPSLVQITHVAHCLAVTPLVFLWSDATIR